MSGVVAQTGLEDAIAGYAVFRVDKSTCAPELDAELEGLESARLLCMNLRADFEACAGYPAYGPLGTFEGVLAPDMPPHWRNTGTMVGCTALWVPNARHPLGRWLAMAAERLLALPPPEILDAILRRHGIESSGEFASQFMQTAHFWAILVHKPRVKSMRADGVSRDDSLFCLWRNPSPAEVEFNVQQARLLPAMDVAALREDS